jgi:hypothetical protein
MQNEYTTKYVLERHSGWGFYTEVKTYDSINGAGGGYDYYTALEPNEKFRVIKRQWVELEVEDLGGILVDPTEEKIPA